MQIGDNNPALTRCRKIHLNQKLHFNINKYIKAELIDKVPNPGYHFFSAIEGRFSYNELKNTLSGNVLLHLNIFVLIFNSINDNSNLNDNIKNMTDLW